MSKQTRDLLAAYYAGELTPDQVADLSRRLVVDPDLAEALVRFGMDQSALERAIRLDKIGDLARLESDALNAFEAGRQAGVRIDETCSIAKALARGEDRADSADAADRIERVLRRWSEPHPDDESDTSPHSLERTHRRTGRRVAWGLGIAASVALLATAAWLGLRPSLHHTGPTDRHADGPPVQQPNRFGSVIRAIDARWGDGRTILVGDTIDDSDYELHSGVLEMRLTHGVRLTIQSPASFRLDDAGHVRLDRGRLCGEVPTNAQGFMVISPHARVVDLGTEFAVDVVSEQKTHVQVFEGEVMVGLKAPGSVPSVLQAGEAREVDGNRVRVTSFVSHRYWREVPTAYEVVVRREDPLAWWSFTSFADGTVPDRGRAGADAVADPSWQAVASLNGRGLGLSPDRRLVLPDDQSGFGLTTDFTIEAWVRVNSVRSSNSRFFSNANVDYSRGFAFGSRGRRRHRSPCGTRKVRSSVAIRIA